MELKLSLFLNFFSGGFTQIKHQQQQQQQRQ